MPPSPRRGKAKKPAEGRGFQHYSNKSILEVLDLAVQYGGNVEADGHLAAERIAPAVRDHAVPPLFFPRDSLGGKPEGVRLPRLHLDKAGITVLALRNDIRLAEGGGVVLCENFIAMFFQIFAGEGLSLPSQNFFTKVFL